MLKNCLLCKSDLEVNSNVNTKNQKLGLENNAKPFPFELSKFICKTCSSILFTFQILENNKYL